MIAEERRRWLHSYVNEKLPGITYDSFHMQEGYLDFSFYPMKLNYFFKVVLQGIYDYLERCNNHGLLSVGNFPGQMEEDEYLFFFRIFWNLGAHSKLANVWPAGIYVSWATKKEREEVWNTTMIQPHFAGGDSYGTFIEPAEAATEAKKADSETSPEDVGG
jgi:hypothetical protein